jgi:hypothetical protein
LKNEEEFNRIWSETIMNVRAINNIDETSERRKRKIPAS